MSHLLELCCNYSWPCPLSYSDMIAYFLCLNKNQVCWHVGNVSVDNYCEYGVGLSRSRFGIIGIFRLHTQHINLCPGDFILVRLNLPVFLHVPTYGEVQTSKEIIIMGWKRCLWTAWKLVRFFLSLYCVSHLARFVNNTSKISILISFLTILSSHYSGENITLTKSFSFFLKQLYM